MRAFRFIEKLLVVLGIIGLVMKYTFVPGGGLFITIALNLLACQYFIFSWFYFKGEYFNKNLSRFSFLAGTAFAIGCIGTQFKLMYWPGAEQQLLLAVIFSVAVTAYATYKRKRNGADDPHDKHYRAIVDRGMIVVLMAAIVFAIPTSSLINYEYRNDPKLAGLMINFLKDPDNRDKWEALQNYRMNEIMDNGPGDTLKTPIK